LVNHADLLPNVSIDIQVLPVRHSMEQWNVLLQRKLLLLLLNNQTFGITF